MQNGGRKTKRKGRRRESDLRRIVNLTPQMLMIMEPHGRITWANRVFLDYFGIRLAELSSDDLAAHVLHPDDRQQHDKERQGALAHGLPFESELRMRSREGKYRWFFVRYNPLTDAKGSVVRWYGGATDIEERKLAEEAARLRQKELQDIVDTIPAAIFVALADGSGEIANRRWFEYHGAPSRQCGHLYLKQWLEAYIHPRDLDGFLGVWKLCMATGKPFEYEARLHRADGQYRWNLVRAEPLRDEQEEILKWYGIDTDIEDQKRAEQALRQSEAYLAEAQRLSHTGSWAFDLASEKYVYVSEECFRIFELNAQLGAPNREAVSLHIDPEDWNGVQASFEKSVRERVDTSSEFRIVLPSGTTKHILAIRHPVLNDAGDVTELVGTVIDITERKRAEEALRRSEAYLAETQKLTHTGTFVSDCTTQPLFWSDELFRIFGFDPQRGLPTRDQLVERLHPDDLDKVWQVLQRAIHGKADADVEYRVVLPDGTVKHVHSLAHPVLDTTGEVVEVAGSTVDITGRKCAERERERLRQLEADLAHINRVSMMGELAASIAHEVNQPLSGIVSNGSACLRRLAGDKPNVEEVREAVRDIVRDGKRAGEVIARIRALTKRTAPAREELDLNETIGEILMLVGNQARRNSVMIRTRLTDDVFPVLGDRVQLQQVVLNLVMNGMEAMSSVGDRARELVITTRNVDANQVQVTVQDSGIGLDPNRMARIFEPFYTTKSGGMGMGLSISGAIVQNHGGRLWATANDGPGASFNFTVPKYQEKGSHAGVAGV
jgi:PAS domain S-box-containing protein